MEVNGALSATATAPNLDVKGEKGMAAVPATDDEKAAAIAEDLQYLLSDCGCSMATQAKVYDALGAQATMSQFALLGEEVKDVRPAIRDVFAIDETVGRVERLQTMSLLATWKKSKARAVERDSAEAHAIQTGKTLQFPLTDHRARKAAYETKFHEIDEDDLPAKAYIELLETRLAEGDLRAEHLREVTTKDIEDDDEGDMVLEKDKDGFLKTSRTRKKASEGTPKDPEELRRAIRRMGIAWSMIALKHTNKKYLGLDSGSLPEPRERDPW